MKKIIISLLTIAIIVTVVAGSTASFFSDKETSIGNTFTAGTIDISVNEENPWTEIFTWEDVKPGKDFEVNLIIKNVGENSAKIWKSIKNVVTQENEIIEPEQEWYDKFNNGDPKNDIDTAIIYQMEVDGAIIIDQADGTTIGEIKDSYLFLGELAPDEAMTVKQIYLMNKNIENWAQSDQMIFEMEILAQQLNAPEPLNSFEDFEDEEDVSIQLGDVVINEIMQNPDEVTDANGEWFEIYNITGSDAILDGCIVKDSGTDLFTITSLTILAGEYTVLSRNIDSMTNGGIDVDYEYTGFTLGNSDDEIILTCNGVEIDRVEYDGGSDFINPTGASMSLDNPGSDNNVGGNWFKSTCPYGAGDLGTPGYDNNKCQKTITFNNLNADPQFGYVHDYGNANVSFIFMTPSDNKLSGTIIATGLKPYATYQMKFEGKPVCLYGALGDDILNDYIGSIGRWWNNDINANVNSNSPTDCITGYLVWDYVTADASGNVTKSVETANSHHVFWCGGGTCDVNNNSQLQNLDGGVNPPGFPYCAPSDVNGEIERFTYGGLNLNSGSYDLRFILNEESFHQSSFGFWTSVMDAEINFTIN